MTIGRRTLSIDWGTGLGGVGPTLRATSQWFATTVSDATGRTITGPDRVTRGYPAGPPAAISLDALAPDLPTAALIARVLTGRD